MNAIVLSRDNRKQLHLGPVPPRLLIVGDSTDRLRAMRAALTSERFQVVEAHTVAEVRAVCCELELAIVDAGATDIIALLRALRTSVGCEQIPILVVVNGLSDELRAPGLLSSYRAMPCGQADLMKLVRCYLHSGTETYNREVVL